MAQFSNGSEAMGYVEKWCMKCIHHGDCPILAAHEIYHHKDEVGEVLDMLIPVGDDGYNKKCTMFITKGKGEVCDGSPLFPPQKG